MRLAGRTIRPRVVRTHRAAGDVRGVGLTGKVLVDPEPTEQDAVQVRVGEPIAIEQWDVDLVDFQGVARLVGLVDDAVQEIGDWWSPRETAGDGWVRVDLRPRIPCR